MNRLSVLGILVTDQQVDRWVDFYAPGPQPFRTKDLDPHVVQVLAERSVEITDELRDTFFMYGGGPWTWLSEREFNGLSPGVRALLAGERRDRTRPKPTPAWPSDAMVVPKMIRWVEAGSRPSLHALAEKHLRHASAGPLPRAAELAGTFPQGSGPNCFGTVMAATGLPAENHWVQLDEFSHWLDHSTEPATRLGSDIDAGRVLVWHQSGELAHAAVTIGGGWVLHKPSQSWSSPVLVWTVEEVIRSWQLPGTQLSRHTLR